jgi:hypothetical protein
VTLVEYLRLRKQVELAGPILEAQADELAEQVKVRNLELITVERMWDELIRLAESKETGF